MEQIRYTYCPKVTIVIPVYNGEKFMRDAIDSALNQSYGNIEVLVVNDGSNDDTDQIAKSYGKKIRYIVKENGGVSTALNVAIRNMNGEWLSWLSHDDIYCKNKIECQIRELNEIIAKNNKEDIETYVLCCANDRIDEKGKHVNRKVHYGKNYLTPKETLIDQIGNYSIGGCCVLAHRNAYISTGGFNEANRTCSDAEMWYKLLLNNYRFVFMPVVLVHSRQHRNMVSVLKKDLCEKEGEKLHRDTADVILDNSKDIRMKYRCLIALCKRGYSDVALELFNKIDAKRPYYYHLKIYALLCCAKNKVRQSLRMIYRWVRY